MEIDSVNNHPCMKNFLILIDHMISYPFEDKNISEYTRIDEMPGWMNDLFAVVRNEHCSLSV